MKTLLPIFLALLGAFSSLSAELPVVSIAATRPETAEPGPTIRVISGALTLSRTGSLDQSLTVFIHVEGTATAGRDYQELPPTVTFNAQQATKVLEVVALDDTLIEPDETVVVRLVPPPVETSVPRYTVAAERAAAKVTIHDTDTAGPATITITEPKNGAALPAHSDVRVEAVAVDPKGYIPRLEFYDNDRLFAVSEIAFFVPPEPGTPIQHSVLWTNPPAGEHVLTARGTDSTGHRITSSPVRVTVANTENQKPRTAILEPANGAVFEPGQPITVRAEASDPDGTIQQLDLRADGQLLQRVNVGELKFIWSNAPAGEHRLSTRAVDNAGAVAESSVLAILVRASAPTNEPFARRVLPDSYSQSVRFTVTIRAEPRAGTFGWAVEDRPPRGWTVSNISNEGLFDSTTGKVKFGPFQDATARSLTYQLLPTADSTGRAEFEGSASANGVSSVIAGDRVIEPARRYHPADTNSDFVISLNELTAYVAAWKSAPTSPLAPVPISFVTRAAQIWRNGEGYKYVPGDAPLCWVPLAGDNLAHALTLPSAERFLDDLSVRIRVQPQSATAFALEERLPSGWKAVDVSSGGVFLESGGLIRWGPVTETSNLQFTYRLVPEVNRTPLSFSLILSADGVNQQFGGEQTNPTARPLRIPNCARLENGGLRLTLEGGAGEVCQVEASSDLQTWIPVRRVFLPDGTLDFEHSAERAEKFRFYRLHAD